jgi:hypothetical protein
MRLFSLKVWGLKTSSMFVTNVTVKEAMLDEVTLLPLLTVLLEGMDPLEEDNELDEEPLEEVPLLLALLEV